MKNTRFYDFLFLSGALFFKALFVSFWQAPPDRLAVVSYKPWIQLFAVQAEKA